MDKYGDSGKQDYNRPPAQTWLKKSLTSLLG